MKTKTVVGCTALLCAAMTGGYWIGFERGKSQIPRINAVSNLKQIGLGFRNNRNDVTRFTATGIVTATKAPAEGR
jgi:hypothetical protein